MTNNIGNFLKQFFIIVSGFCFMIVIVAWNNTEETPLKYRESISKTEQNKIPSIILYDAIIKHSKKYNIPLDYAFGIAYTETKYTSPFDFDYAHNLSSSAGAVGPMQVMLNTARYVWNCDTISKERLKNDIDFNVETSMKVLSYYKSKHHDWLKTFGAYNSGQPIINHYARTVHKYRFDSTRR